MAKKHPRYNLFILIGLLVVLAATLAFLVFNTKKSASGTASITASPASGEHKVEDPFAIAIVATGGDEAYTGFAATVSLTNLTVVSLNAPADVPLNQMDALDPGLFARWVAPPSTSNLNFEGGVKNTKTGTLTVYIVTVKGIAEGDASINITNGEILQVVGSDIVNIISSPTSTGSYTITAAPPAESCSDGILNQNETSIDHGGICPPVGATPTCTDKVKNGTETAVDCGGGTCPACAASAKKNATAPKSTTSTPSTPTTVTPTETLLDTLLKLTDETAFIPIWTAATSTKSFIINVEAPTTTIPDQTTITGAIFSGKALPGTKVDLFVFSTLSHYTAVADAEYNWKIVSDQPLDSGDHNAYAVLTEKDTGNFFRSETVFAFSVDPITNKVEKITDTTNAATTDTALSTAETTKSKFDTKTLMMIAGIILIIAGVVVGLFFWRKKKLAQSTAGMDFSQPSGSWENKGESLSKEEPESGAPVENSNPVEPTVEEPVVSQEPEISENQPTENTETPETPTATEVTEPIVEQTPVTQEISQPEVIEVESSPTQETPVEIPENDQAITEPQPETTNEAIDTPVTPPPIEHGYNYVGSTDSNQSTETGQNVPTNSEPEKPIEDQNNTNLPQNNSQV